MAESINTRLEWLEDLASARDVANCPHCAEPRHVVVLRSGDDTVRCVRCNGELPSGGTAAVVVKRLSGVSMADL